MPGVSALVARSPAFLRSLAAPGLDAAGQGVSNVVGQVGTTAGTTQGLTVDPAQAAAAALQAAGARRLGIMGKQAGGAAVGAAGAAKSAVGNKIADVGTNMAIKGLPPMSDEQAASITRINSSLDAQAPANPNANGTQRVNALWKQQRAALGDTIDAAIQSGKVDQSTGAMLQTAMQQAAVHKSALDTNLLTKLNSPTIDPQLATTLRNGLTDLDGLSQMVNYKQATGPYAALASKVVNGLAMGGAALAGLHGNFGDASEIGLAALGGHSTGLTGIAGKVLGGGLDRIAGTAQPPGILLRAKALQQAQAAGLDTSQDALSPVTAAGDALRSLQAQQGQAAADAVARAKAADLMEAAANKLLGQDYKNSGEGIVARARMAAQRADIIAQAKADGRIPQPMTQDQRDRVSIGLPPSDPIPVNVPLGANNQPLVQAASGAPQAPRPVSPLGQQPVPLQVAPATPQAAPQAGYRPNGWLDHLSTHLVNNGIVPSPQVIGKALGGLVASGKMSSDYADHILSDPTQFIGDRGAAFQQIVAQAMQDHGMQPPPVVSQPVSPLKYGLAVQSRQALGTAMASQAAAEGDPMLQVEIARIMATPEVSGKQAIRQQVLDQRQHDAAALERANRLMPPELFKGKAS